MAKKSKSYTESIRELEEILERVENGDLDVDDLSKEISRASELIKYCKEKLYVADEEVKKILDKMD